MQTTSCHILTKEAFDFDTDGSGEAYLVTRGGDLCGTIRKHTEREFGACGAWLTINYHVELYDGVGSNTFDVRVDRSHGRLGIPHAGREVRSAREALAMAMAWARETYAAHATEAGQ